jgi:hypothetical protein
MFSRIKRMNTVSDSTHLQVGSLIFPQIDQADFTAPFEIFSRIPNSKISRTVSDSADLDTETHALYQALIAAEGWMIP